ncbi:MAG: benzoate-CoA ligase family protein [Devosiaceae bacterium]|nr:benzoate-CoA ligase family protein [Devosiaceae bacterium MH13]
MSEPGLKAQLAADVGFDLAENYNASRLLWDNLANNAHRPAVHHASGVWSYAELAGLASQIGNTLLDAGCQPGDRVLLLMDDEPAHPAAIMGAMRAGLVPLLTNIQSPPDLLTFFLKDSSAKAAVASPELADLLSGADIPVFKTNDPKLREASEELTEAKTARRDMAFWMYSSGSTGRPKGVVHKHEDVAYTAHTYARSVLNLTADDICFSVPKIYFAYGFGNAVSFPMSVGASALLLSGRPTPGRCFEAIGKHKPTVLFGLPTVYTALMNAPEVDNADLASVRLCISAAEVLSSELANDWKRRFGHNIVEGLGSTEMLHIYLSNDETTQKPGSAGKTVPGYAVRLVDQKGDLVAAGEEGIMEVCGLSGAEYYWNRPDKTEDTMRGEWLYTGDRFTCDDDGFYYFKGRADDLVKVSGQWVYPLEIELALAEHPKVQEVCVQAVPMADQRMTLTAWVTPKEADDAGEGLERELKDFAKSQLLPYKYPRTIHFLDTLPKTGTDKIDRQALRALSSTSLGSAA